jgi:hypothetical protein
LRETTIDVTEEDNSPTKIKTQHLLNTRLPGSRKNKPRNCNVRYKTFTSKKNLKCGKI